MDDRGQKPAGHREEDRDSANPPAMERYSDDHGHHGVDAGAGFQQRRDGPDLVHQAIYSTYK